MRLRGRVLLAWCRTCCLGLRLRSTRAASASSLLPRGLSLLGPGSVIGLGGGGGRRLLRKEAQGVGGDGGGTLVWLLAVSRLNHAMNDGTI